ncbi:MAG: YkgJ family cysteine cluster protein [Myxococcales bacterium]|nr:YkgJ family cysteine cluster protein [Myxococcales bacterium]
MGRRIRATLQPLIARPGARYRCFGDGLCCTDVHGLGPISEAELHQMRSIDPEGAAYAEDFEDRMLCAAADGGCVFLLPNGYCRVHVEQGEPMKPDGCRRFPLGLVATPRGGRITTEHRCPCRTLGERPAIDPGAVIEALTDADGDMDPELEVKKVRLGIREKISFEQWEAIEAELLGQLARGRSPAKLLEAAPFPKLSRTSWYAQAHVLLGARDGSQFGAALGWFADTILHLIDGRPARPPARPWAAAFDRAEARSPVERKAREVINDWIADEIWSLGWNEDSSFAHTRVELATRLAIAEDIVARLRKLGLRQDRAAAEAVMIVEIVGESEHWAGIVDKMRF